MINFCIISWETWFSRGRERVSKKKKKRTGVEHLAAARAKSLAKPKFCKFAIYTARLPLTETRTYKGPRGCRNPYKRGPTYFTKQANPNAHTARQAGTVPSSFLHRSTRKKGGKKLQLRHRPGRAGSPLTASGRAGRESPQASLGGGRGEGGNAPHTPERGPRSPSASPARLPAGRKAVCVGQNTGKNEAASPADPRLTAAASPRSPRRRHRCCGATPTGSPHGSPPTLLLKP